MATLRGGPGDVLLRSAYGDVFIEIVTFGPDENRELDEGHQRRHQMHLMALSGAPDLLGGVRPRAATMPHLRRRTTGRCSSATKVELYRCTAIRLRGY
jgi:hypothetical protein